jgi:hypothetical protein
MGERLATLAVHTELVVLVVAFREDLHRGAAIAVVLLHRRLLCVVLLDGRMLAQATIFMSTLANKLFSGHHARQEDL